MSDPFLQERTQLESPAYDAFPVVKSNSIDLATYARALWVGTAGNLKITTAGGTTVQLSNVPSGTIIPIRTARVWADSTADQIVALF